MNAVVPPEAPPNQVGSPADMKRLFLWCRTNKWEDILAEIKIKPWLATTTIMMENHITTTILHQAITSKGDVGVRAKVIRTILANTPEAAREKNGYGSLPLHVITQRNTKLDAKTKESLIRELIRAYEAGLSVPGGTGRRTPVHIVFTDYVSLALSRMMIITGREACFIKDRKGWLPAHVACSRHVSPLKLKMLLRINPAALTERTHDGDTLITLARKTATRSHPNHALIDEIGRLQDDANALHWQDVPRGLPIRRDRLVADLVNRHRVFRQELRGVPPQRPRIGPRVNRPRIPEVAAGTAARVVGPVASHNINHHHHHRNNNNHHVDDAETLLLFANRNNNNRVVGDDDQDRPMEVVRV